MAKLKTMKLRFGVGAALAFALILSGGAPGLAQNSHVNSVLDKIQGAARAYANPVNNDRVIVQSQNNQQLAAIIAANNQRRAEFSLAAMVIEAISRNPALADTYVSAVAAAAPAMALGVTRQVRQAYPYQMIRVTVGPSRTAQPDVNFDELAEADAEGDDPSSDQNDPFEGVNRVIFTVNDTLDTYFFRPIAWTYGWIMPEFAKPSISKAFRNLRSPAIFGNNLLQGEFGDAGVTFLRFVINSTVGIAGLFDIAEEFDLEQHDADFGQTLHAYNIGAGIYVVLPLFGPVSARDGVGRLIDTFMDPITYLLGPSDRALFGLGRSLVRREELLEQLDELRKTSVDYYAAIRSLYYQDRARILRRGRPPAGADFEEILKVEE
jgi:phospholipid-binding lipoprotein MlaA